MILFNIFIKFFCLVELNCGSVVDVVDAKTDRNEGEKRIVCGSIRLINELELNEIRNNNNKRYF